MVDIIKASGEKEKFSREKLYNSLRRARVESRLAERVCKDVVKIVRSKTGTKEILNRAFRCLKKESPILAARYNLKRAIMQLGPTGFPFEKYVAAILKEYGYAVKVGKLVRGRCVAHEVDVIARKANNQFMIECKYHNSRGIRSDVKVAMYTYARFLDIKKQREKISGHQNSRAQNNFVLGRAPKHIKHHYVLGAPIFHQAWLVTNTKCTKQAIRYARCVGLKIISWRYPKNESLEYLIEKKGVYPITILPSLTRYVKENLAQGGIILARDLLEYSINDLVKISGLQPNVLRKLQQQVKELSLS